MTTAEKTKETPVPPTSLLPGHKTPANVGIETSKILIYGDQKIGKSTLASQLNPDETLFLATEPGLAAIEAFQLPIGSWEEFLAAGAELAKGKHQFKLLIVDTVDALASMCEEYVVKGLAAAENIDPTKYVHASEFEWGKGWDAIAAEFRLRVSKLCNLGMGVVFISHTKEGSMKRHGLEITTYGPDVGKKGMRKWLLGYVDFIAHATKSDKDGATERVLQLQPTETVHAGMRVPDAVREKVPTYIPLDAAVFRKLVDAVAKATAEVNKA